MKTKTANKKPLKGGQSLDLNKSKSHEIRPLNATNLPDEKEFDPDLDMEDDGFDPDKAYEEECIKARMNLTLNYKKYFHHLLPLNVRTEKNLTERADEIIKIIGKEAHDYIMNLLEKEMHRLADEIYDILQKDAPM